MISVIVKPIFDGEGRSWCRVIHFTILLIQNSLIRWKTGRNTKRSGDDDDDDHDGDHDDNKDDDDDDDDDDVDDDDDDDDDDDTNNDDKEDDVYACSCEYSSKPQLVLMNAVHVAPL